MKTRIHQLSRRRFLEIGAMGAATLAFDGLFAFGAAPKAAMSHRERIEKALAHEENDRLPFGFWWHFPNRDRAPRRLAELALALQQELDLDFIKFSPYGLYSVLDWGVTLDMKAGLVSPPVQLTYPVKKPEDWKKTPEFQRHRG